MSLDEVGMIVKLNFVLLRSTLFMSLWHRKNRKKGGGNAPSLQVLGSRTVKQASAKLAPGGYFGGFGALYFLLSHGS